MWTRLRLRVLLPAAAVALVGVGVSAFAFGSGTAVAPPPAAPPAAAPVAWVDQAAALCATTVEEGLALGLPRTLARLGEVAAAGLDLERQRLAGLRALVPPAADRAAVDELLALLAERVAADERRVATGDPAASLHLLSSAAGDAERTALELGVPECAVRAVPSADGFDLGALGLLRDELAAKAVVVLVFYAPGSAVDAYATREARAGADDVGAGFVAVDVTSERDVAALAGELGVRDAPTVVVVRRDRGAETRIPGFVDRATVAQAAANAEVL